jgi:dihydroxyacid dehydratase/phosphogluconate dehydratase
LHLLAMAHAAGVKLSLDDFTKVGRRVPVLADLKPSGRHLMSELVAIGGIQPMMKMLLDAGLLHGDCLTVTGKTMAENLAGVQPYPRAGDHPPAGQSDQEGQPPGHSLRQPRAGRGGGQNHRQGRHAL